MKIVERHRTPLTRQVQEGVELELSKADVVMNSKAEWNHSRLPQIVIEQGEKQAEDNENGITRGVKEVEKKILLKKRIPEKRKGEKDDDCKESISAVNVNKRVKMEESEREAVSLKQRRILKEEKTKFRKRRETQVDKSRV